jgi:hypothetical protein
MGRQIRLATQGCLVVLLLAVPGGAALALAIVDSAKRE